MKHLISERFASIGLISILALVIVFHFLVLSGLIPYDMVWGGRLKTHDQMLAFETTSIVINLIMITIAAINTGLLKLKVNRLLIRLALSAMGLLFLLNTIGNLLSTNSLEKMIFTPLTLLLAIFCLRLVATKNPQPAFQK